MEKYLMPFFIALAITYTLTPYAKKLAYKIGAVDVPKDDRRVHTKPIPRLGGVAIYLAFVITTILVVFLIPELVDTVIQNERELVGIMIGATIIVLVGIIDDVKQISAKYKLAAQIVAALIVIYSGVRIEFISDPFNKGEMIALGAYYSIPFTIFWIVGITNTVNLIDGLDGLAAGVSMIASVSLAFVAYLSIPLDPSGVQVGVAAILLMILAGSTAGFLPYNFNPAQIFMGDTGSLLIGFILASVSIEGVIKSATTIAVAVPVLALGVPVFDTTCAILRRLINKRPIMEADKGHLHHILLEQGLSQRQTVLILYFISTIFGSIAVLISDASRATAYLVLVTITFAVTLAALRIGLVKKTNKMYKNW